jgi:hypothetical protein
MFVTFMARILRDPRVQESKTNFHWTKAYNSERSKPAEPLHFKPCIL